MVVFPPCKINLGLAVVGKRPDGYHDLETGFYPVPFTDVLEAIPAPRFSFTTTGLPIDGEPESNLAVKAFRLLEAEIGIPAVKMHLHKIVPMGAGLGGGSSDGAYALRLMCSLFELELTEAQLSGYALRLGSDCPFFLQDKPMMGKGRGEKLAAVDVDLSGKHLVVVVLPIHVSTKEAFSGVAPKTPSFDVADLLGGPISDWKRALQNDFETSVFKRHPEIARCKEQLYDMGALYSSMTGTGSGVYGIFEKPLPVPITNRFPDATTFSVDLP